VTAGVSIGAAWRAVRDRFRAQGMDTPELDARLLAQAAFGLDAMGLVRREREPATPAQLVGLDRFALRRLAGEPISRIVGEQEFWGLKFVLSQATLVPRPETEQLVEEALARLAGLRAPRIVDLGTGSGAIIVSILEALPRAHGLATDISEAALATARQNAERHGVAGRLDFRQGHWWQAVPHTELFDLIVSNPPYIATAAIADLAPEVRVFDPKAALDGGWDGLEAYRAIASQAARRLVPKGHMLLEIGYNQAEAVSRVFRRAGFGRVEILKDLAGLDRVVSASHS
jgi:release factor glutamine methyltransferase